MYYFSNRRRITTYIRPIYMAAAKQIDILFERIGESNHWRWRFIDRPFPFKCTWHRSQKEAEKEAIQAWIERKRGLEDEPHQTTAGHKKALSRTR